MIKLKEKLKEKKSLVIILCAAVAGVALICYSPVTGTAKTDEADSYVSYTEKLEERIRDICTAVEGVEKASVLVTLECGSEYVYADNIMEERQSENASSYVSDYLIVNSGDGEEPVVVTEIYPRIRGVAVVCPGGDGVVMQKKLTELLSAALGIGASKIKITS